jgi:hypothetical protein
MRAVWLVRDEADPAFLTEAREREVPVVTGLSSLGPLLGL